MTDISFTDDDLNFETLKKMCNGFFSDEDLRTFYKHSEKSINKRLCSDCSLKRMRENAHLFYDNEKNLRCIECSRKIYALKFKKRKERLLNNNSRILN